VFDAYLVRQTERRLIGESVVIGETWREALAQEMGIFPEKLGSFRPPEQREDGFVPITAMVELGYTVLPPAPAAVRHQAPDGTPSATMRAGARITPLLERVQVFSVSAAHVLDSQGCTIAPSLGEPSECLDHLIEVQRALGGQYGAVVRQRRGDEPLPPLASLRRDTTLRVFTAMPVFIEERIAAVVWMSRTAAAPLQSLWNHRVEVGGVLALGLVLTPAVTWLLSRAISRPVRERGAESDRID